MTELISKEQKDSLYEKLLLSVSDILSEEMDLPKRPLEEIEQIVAETDSCLTLE